MSSEIRSALGLSEQFRLSNGATLPVAPCSIKDLSRAMALYSDTFNKFTVQQMFLPENASVKDDLFELLLMASGNGNKEGKARDKALDEVLDAFTDIGDFGMEVVRYAQRFLRIIPGNTGPEEKEE